MMRLMEILDLKKPLTATTRLTLTIIYIMPSESADMRRFDRATQTTEAQQKQRHNTISQRVKKNNTHLFNNPFKVEI